MGNLISLDMGIVMLRCTIFDKRGRLKTLLPEPKEEEKKDISRFGDTLSVDGFTHSLTFHSTPHNGTFYFLEFNILRTSEFFKSEAFKALSIFIEEELDELVKSPTAFAFDKLLPHKLPEFKHPPYINVNYMQLKKFLGDTKLKAKLKKLGKNTTVPSSGGYNDFYLNFLQDTFSIKIQKTHAFFSYVVLAIEFLNKNTDECFFDLPGQDATFLHSVGKIKAKLEPRYFSKKSTLYPYLLVSVRSGVVFLRVDGPKNFKKLDGSSIGASTFLGLLKLLTNYKYPHEALEGAREGDNTKIDLSVGDIYGGDYSAIGLPAHIIASSFGKLRSKPLTEVEGVKDEDISRSLMTMVAANTLQIAYMLSMLENLSTIVLIGSHFDAPEFLQTCSVSMNFWSQGKKSLIYPRHSSFLACLGVYLHNFVQRDRINSL